jgi:drug/metabolite transporter (DMT)-like permease
LSKRSVAVIFAVAGILLFSTKAIFAKLMYQMGVDHMSALMLRMLFASPVYFIIFFGIKKSANTTSAKDHLYLFLLGFVGYYLASFLDFKGLTYIKASLERLILFIYPTLVIIISALVLKKHISNVQKMGVLITYLGIVIVFLPELVSSSSQSNAHVVTGALLIFFSALTYAIYLVGSQWLIPKFGAKKFTTIAMLWSGFFVLCHYTATSDAPVSILEWNYEVYLLGAAMGLISTILPSFFISFAIHKLGAAEFSIFGSLGPVSTIVLAYVFLGERLTPLQIAGSLVVISGVVLAEYFGKKAARVSP